MSLHPLPRVFLLLALLAFGGGGALRAQATDRAGVVLRVVDDSSGKPIEGARVVLEGSRAGVYTDTLGIARVLRITPGSQKIRVGRLGYRAELVPLELSAGAPVEAEVRLTLDPVRLRSLEVAAERLDPYLTRQGVYGRARFAGTARFGPAFEKKAARASFLHELFYATPGLDVMLNRYGSGYMLRSTRGIISITGTCYPTIYLDGFDTTYRRSSHANIDEIVQTPDIAAIEVYLGPAETPAEYGGMNSCGVVLIWTKHGG